MPANAGLPMKSRYCQLAGLCLLFAVNLAAQDPARPPGPLPTEQELDQLFGPIALYPDALIALILPAATVPDDVAQAAGYLQDGGDPVRTDEHDWDDSVKALMHYPEVMKWMGQNLPWTRQVGAAFLDERAAVLNSIQRLRTRAMTTGALFDTPQQRVLVEDGLISVIPAEPDILYVPDYDPDLVYAAQPGYHGSAYVTFGLGYPTGLWLGYDLDWSHHRVWEIEPSERADYWRNRGDWRRPAFPGRPGYKRDPERHPWAPTPGSLQPLRPSLDRPGQTRSPIVRPAPFPNPTRPDDARRNPAARPPDDHPALPADRRTPAPDGRAENRPDRFSPPVTAPAQPAPSPRRPEQTEPDDRTSRDNRERDTRAEPTGTPGPGRVMNPPAAAPARPPAARQAPPPARENRDSRDSKDAKDTKDDRDDRRDR